MEWRRRRGAGARGWYMRIRVPMQIRSRSRCHRELAKAGLECGRSVTPSPLRITRDSVALDAARGVAAGRHVSGGESGDDLGTRRTGAIAKKVWIDAGIRR